MTVGEIQSVGSGPTAQEIVEENGFIEDTELSSTQGDDYALVDTDGFLELTTKDDPEGIAATQYEEGVVYYTDDEGNVVLINNDAGDVTVTAEMLAEMFGDENGEYDSNTVKIILDQDNVTDEVGKVDIQTDVGSIVVDNDNDFSKLDAGTNTNISKVDLSVSGQTDDLVITQSIDVTTMGWNTAGNGEHNIGVQADYNLDSADSNITIDGSINSALIVEDDGVEGLMAGNEVNVTSSGNVEIVSEMTNNFVVGDVRMGEDAIPLSVANWLEDNGYGEEEFNIVNAEENGITDVNYYAHGRNEGDGIILMNMGDGRWVVTGSGVPQTYTFDEVEDSSGDSGDSCDPTITDPFNKVNVSAASADNPISVDIDQLQQTNIGNVYGVENYHVENSISSGESVTLAGEATQTIQVGTVDSSLDEASGNFINGEAATGSKATEEVAEILQVDLGLEKTDESDIFNNLFLQILADIINQHNPTSVEAFKDELLSSEDFQAKDVDEEAFMENLAERAGAEVADLTVDDIVQYVTDSGGEITIDVADDEDE